jgi:hypothetical protein
MSSAASKPKTEAGYATAVKCDGTSIWVTLSTGEVVRDSVDRYRFLSEAPLAARRKVRVVGWGIALWWPELDEELGVNTIIGVSEEEVARAAGYTIYSSHPGEELDSDWRDS